MSKKKTQIEIKARYIAIGKQFVGFSLRQKRIPSLPVMLAEDDTLTIYKTYIKIYLRLLVTIAKSVSKPKWNNYTQILLESSQKYTSYDYPRGDRNWSPHLSSLTIKSKSQIWFLSLVNNMNLTKVFGTFPIYKTNIYKNRTIYIIHLICKYWLVDILRSQQSLQRCFCC